MARGHERDIITRGENFRSKFSRIRAVNDSNILNCIRDSYGGGREIVSWIEESSEKELQRHKEGWRKNMCRVVEREREREKSAETSTERKSAAKRKLSIYSKRYLTTTTRAIYRHAFQHTAWKRTVRKRSFKEEIHTLTYIPGVRLNLYDIQDVLQRWIE